MKHDMKGSHLLLIINYMKIVNPKTHVDITDLANKITALAMMTRELSIIDIIQKDKVLPKRILDKLLEKGLKIPELIVPPMPSMDGLPAMGSRGGVSAKLTLSKSLYFSEDDLSSISSAVMSLSLESPSPGTINGII